MSASDASADDLSSKADSDAANTAIKVESEEKKKKFPPGYKMMVRFLIVIVLFLWLNKTQLIIAHDYIIFHMFINILLR